MNVGIARRSANAAEVCGDLAGAWARNGSDVIAIADGLGHGIGAAQASVAAIETVAAWPGDDLLALFRQTNEALRPTRGAALAVATVDWAASTVTYAAVGNTRAALFSHRATHLRGYAGVVGAGYRRLSTFTVRFNQGDVLALWTDGLDEHIDLTVADRAASRLDDMASALLGRFARGNDDCCVIVAHLVAG